RTEEQNAGIVKIKFPVKELGDLNLREKIHNAFNAERIGFDLFIKYNSGEKEQIHTELVISLKNQTRNWWTNSNAICVVESRDLRPDVGVWVSVTNTKAARPKCYVRAKSVSRESTPRPTTCSIKRTLLVPPNTEIIEEYTYEKVKNKIFQSEYSEIEPKITSETKIEDNQATEEV
ncbi:2746_t:CDS:2, partial [Dentiscutata erythropus]